MANYMPLGDLLGGREVPLGLLKQQRRPLELTYCCRKRTTSSSTVAFWGVWARFRVYLDIQKAF